MWETGELEGNKCVSEKLIFWSGSNASVFVYLWVDVSYLVQEVCVDTPPHCTLQTLPYYSLELSGHTHYPSLACQSLHWCHPHHPDAAKNSGCHYFLSFLQTILCPIMLQLRPLSSDTPLSSARQGRSPVGGASTNKARYRPRSFECQSQEPMGLKKENEGSS